MTLFVFVFFAAVSIWQLSSLASGFTVAKASEVSSESELFSDLPYKTCSGETRPAKGKMAVPSRIIIDAVSINLPVEPVPLENGTWSVSESVANFAEGTSLINAEAGNVGIFAHDRLKGFKDIKGLKEGDTIVVYGNLQSVQGSGDNKFFPTSIKSTYSVEYASITEPTNVEVFYETPDPTLTLVTCSGVFSERRYVVRAKLISMEELDCLQNIDEIITN